MRLGFLQSSHKSPYRLDARCHRAFPAPPLSEPTQDTPSCVRLWDPSHRKLFRRFLHSGYGLLSAAQDQANTETRTIPGGKAPDEAAITGQQAGRNREHASSKDPAPPFKGRIEPKELPCVAMVEGVEHFAEDEECKKYRPQKACQRIHSTHKRHGERQNEQRPKYDKELSKWRVLCAVDELELHVACGASKPHKKRKQEKDASRNSSHHIAQMPLTPMRDASRFSRRRPCQTGPRPL